MPHRDFPPVHPGEQLREEFMKPLELTAYRLAKDINVPVSRIQAIIDEKRGITGDTALRLGRYFNTTPEFWLNMQRDFGVVRFKVGLDDGMLGDFAVEPAHFLEGVQGGGVEGGHAAGLKSEILNLRWSGRPDSN